MNSPMTTTELKSALCDPGAFVREHMREPDVSLRDVAAATGISYHTLRNFLIGRRPGFSVVTLVPLMLYVLEQKGEILPKVKKKRAKSKRPHGLVR